MVFNRKDMAKPFSPNKMKKIPKKLPGQVKPSTSGSTSGLMQRENGTQTQMKVIVRIRPHSEKEIQAANCRTVVNVVDDKMLIFDPKEEQDPFFYQGVAQKGRDMLKKQNKEQQFIFDTVFDTCSTNNDVYEGSTKDLITNLLDGYNCSVFAYGATGAGKTHTMLGNSNDPGITYRTVAELFYEMDNQSDRRAFNLGVTYLEIYNENVQDLLQKSGPLHIRDDGRCGIIVAGLKVTTIQNADELLSLLTRGNKNRTQHPTDANAESSRSHAVFQVYINITSKLDGQTRHVKLSMIDLAGSERASVTGCNGVRLKEGANINKSLLALGNCINNLADGIKHIPYRDSKLTRLLKDSLGGNCRTVMIANIAPSSFSYEDTYNTLRYADRAKKIKTHAMKNIISCEMRIPGYIKMVEEQKKEIHFLKQKLLALEGGVMHMPSEVKENRSTPEDDKYVQDTQNILLELYHKKKLLNEKMLSLESTYKIMCCRIQYKKAADDRLRYLTTAVDPINSDELNASGKSRITKSLHYFKKQRDAIKIQMESVWDELRTIEQEVQKLNEEIESKQLPANFSDTITLENYDLDKRRLQQQCEHVKKITSLQQCEIQSVYTIIKMMSTILQNYYNIVTGYGTMTDKMKQEFKQLIKVLEGVRNIKWSDDTMISHEDFYSTTCLSIKQLMDPLNNEAPIFRNLHNDEDELQTVQSQNNLDITFNASLPDVTQIKEENNCVYTLPNKSDSTLENVTIVQEGLLNDTFSFQDKSTKRVLLDKNSISNKPPAKFSKKLPPIEKGFLHVPASSGKENKNILKHGIVMSSKSIAILNKLKTEKPKILSSTLKNNTSSDEMTFKAMRGKERRGIMNAHPYQKPSNKVKCPAAPPSSRVPW